MINEIVLKISCPDKPGILAAITPFLADSGCDIRESGVYGDPVTKRFFIRMHVTSTKLSLTELGIAFEPIAKASSLNCIMHDLTRRVKVMVAVSKFDHCLTDILHKWKIGTLPIDIVGGISNHPNLQGLCEWHNLPFYHLPITKTTKIQQEAEFANLLQSTETDLVVLARYMQILSDEFSKKLSGKCINIHHSFLPSFKGARPYHQAHKRGVKLIGATAHYVTSDLDEGPIIEQDVRRVTHATTPTEMIAIGREVEASVLSRAIKWHAEHRVFMNQTRTVILQN